MRTAKPTGHSVPFDRVPQTTLDGCVLGVLILAAGATMRKMTREIMLKIVPTALNRAKKRVCREARHACVIKIRRVKRYVCQCCGV